MKFNRIMELNPMLKVLTIGLGVLMLFNGVDKLMGGIDFIVPLLDKQGVPFAEYVAYGVYLGEIVAPLMLLSGYYIRIAGAVIIVDMLFALFLVHQKEIFTLTEHGSLSIELPLLYIIIALAIVLSNEPNK